MGTQLPSSLTCRWALLADRSSFFAPWCRRKTSRGPSQPAPVFDRHGVLVRECDQLVERFTRLISRRARVDPASARTGS
jgi:hypothetical protein